MSESIQQQLIKALADGDLELADRLYRELRPSQPPAKPKAKAKPKKKTTPKPKAEPGPEPKGTPKATPKKKSPPKPPAPKRAKPDPEPAPGRLILPGIYDQRSPRPDIQVVDFDDFRSGRFQAGGHDPRTTFVMPEGRGRGSKVGANGRVQYESRRESMAAAPPEIVPLKDTGRGGYDPAFRGIAGKIDEANGRQDADLYRRPATFKVRVNCVGCRKPFEVFPSNLTPVFEEDLSSDLIYRCVKCCKAGR